MAGISVIVCCYNSVGRIEATLQHLAHQITRAELGREVILVDNASTDHTASYAAEVWQGLGAPMPFKIVAEPLAGLSHARQRGIGEARYDYLVFCDDDNWLDNDYLQVTADILSADASIGVVGGWCKAVGETALPAWFDEVEGYYAVGKQAAQSGDVGKRNFVFGAGMGFRKSEYLRLKEAGFTHLLTDRTGANLVSGGDVEICYMYRLAGFKIWYDERLKFVHYMSGNRLREDYLQKLMAGAREGVKQLQVYDPYLAGKGQPTSIGTVNFLYYMGRFILATLLPGKDAHYFTTYAEAYNPFGFSLNKQSTMLKKALGKLGRSYK
jgi:glycosyltransferase involved in cell wall biosynthesis